MERFRAIRETVKSSSWVVDAETPDRGGKGGEERTDMEGRKTGE
jgi:hypothetical protein